MPPLVTQAQMPYFTLQFLTNLHTPSLGSGADTSARLPPYQLRPQILFHPCSLLQVKSSFSLFTTAPMPVPPNAVALELPPVTSNIRAQILSDMDIDLSLLALLPLSESKCHGMA